MSLPPAASMFAALSHRNFRWLWVGTFCSTSGQWIQTATLGWVAYDITGSSTLLGLVLGMRALPMLLLAPVSGVMADRHDRRHMLAAAQVVMVVASLLLALGLALDAIHVWHLFAFTLCAGAASAFDRTLRGSLVLDVVARADVANAVALNSIAFSISRTLGPAIAGLLIAWTGPAWNFTIQALLYLCVAATVAMVQAPLSNTAPAVEHASAWSDMQEGFRFVLLDPVARMMVFLGLIPPLLLIASFGALMPVFAVDVFRTGPEGLGLMLSAVGVGGVAGGVIAAWVAGYDRIGLLQLASLFTFSFGLIAFALSPNMPVAIVFLVVAGIAEMVYATSTVSTLQMSAPAHMRGRIASVTPIFPAFISLGAIVAGAGAELIGIQTWVIVTAVLAAGTMSAVWAFFPVIRNLRYQQLVEASSRGRPS